MKTSLGYNREIKQDQMFKGKREEEEGEEQQVLHHVTSRSPALRAEPGTEHMLILFAD